jgi:hypothetical protein
MEKGPDGLVSRFKTGKKGGKSSGPLNLSGL